jgi:hypothetical protein
VPTHAIDLLCSCSCSLALVSEQLWPSPGCTEQDEKVAVAQAYKSSPYSSTRLVLRAPYPGVPVVIPTVAEVICFICSSWTSTCVRKWLRLSLINTSGCRSVFVAREKKSSLSYLATALLLRLRVVHYQSFGGTTPLTEALHGRV